jgi:hypothetical protein
MKKEKINLSSIPSDVETTITIGGAFYQRLNKFLIDYADSLGKDNLLKSMYLIKNNRIPSDDSYTFNLETIIVLLKTVEEAFEDAKLSTSAEIEIEVPDDFKSNPDVFKDIMPD